MARATRALLLVAVSMIAQRRDSAAQSCPPAPLLSTTEHAAAFGTWSTAIGDFTNDGKADVIATSLSGLLFFAGNGDGTLEPPTLSPQNEVGSIVTGHFDTDLNLDFAVASFEGLVVFLGNGDGTFQNPVVYQGGSGQQERIASGYFDGDAHVDLVETDASGHQLWISLGNGDGTFTTQPPVALSSSPVDVAVADFNGDGHADLAVALGAFDDTAFALLLGNGDGTFAAPVMVPAGIQQTAISAADLDGDGKADVALGEPTGIVLLRGNGDATFQAPETFATSGNSVTQVIAADVDGDGLLDLVGLQPGIFLEILQSAGHAFSMGPSFLAAGDRLSIGDLNGDGLPDFSLHNFNRGIVELLLSTPGAYLAARSVAPGLEPQLLVAGDFDGDGQTDIFVSGPSNGPDSAVVLNEGGAFRIAWTASLGRNSSGATADFDGDGHTDLALGGSGSGGLSVQFGLGDGTFSPGPVFNLSGPVGVAVADFNGDGIPDIATTSLGNGGVGELNVFLGQGAGTFQLVDPVELPDPTTSLASGDFDGDGALDLVLTFSGYNGSNTIGVLFGNGDGTFRIGGSFLAGVDPFAVSVGDFDEDGHLDVVAANGGSTNVSLLLGDGAGGFAPVRLVNLAGVPLGLAVADIDGDGHLDLATANSSDFDGGTSTSVLLGDGAGGFLAPFVYPTAARPQAVVAGAFGPAGRTGIAIAADNDWVVDIFLNGAMSPVSVSGGGMAIVFAPTVFSVAGTSAHTLTYQWRKDGMPLVDGGTVSGTTTARLIIDPVSFDDAGSYDVIVTDTCGSVGSIPVALSVEFADVPASSPFHADILTIATEGVTSGCGGGNYCPTSPVRRDQMAVFLLKSEHGSSYLPPACTGVFSDVACPSAFADWVEQLATEGVTSGCGGGNYCPSSSVTRAQMAVFLLKTRDGSAYVPPPAVGIFGDVPVGSFGADFIEALYAAAITGGCQTSPLLYCPDNAVLRQQMATFLVRTFTP